MKKFLSFLLALSACIGMAKAADAVKAGEKYDITKSGSVDIEWDTEEVIAEGKAVVVFYYTSDPSHPFLFGPKYVEPKYKNEDGFVRMWADKAHNSYSKNVNGTEHLDLYGYVAAGEYWCYTICDEADIETVASPLTGNGGEGGDPEPAKPVVITKGATVTPSTLYALPLSDEEGYVNDNLVTLETEYTADQYLVVFLNAPMADASAQDFKNLFYNSKDKDFTASATIEDGGDFAFKRYYRVGADSKLDIYAESMNGSIYDDGYTWCYVIVNSLEEVMTIQNPFAKKGEEPVDPVPGQDVENAIVLTNGVAAEFASTNKVLYVKFVAENSGKVSMEISAEANYARWMEEGVMAYGQLKTNYFTNGKEFNVEKGKTYYCRYGFAEDATGTVSFALAAAEQGAARGEAILLESNGQQTLLGTAHVGDDYFNKDTWFKFEKEGAFDGNDLLAVKIGGSNETEVALYADDERDAIKTYAMGSGTGMLAKNSTVLFDIDLAQHDYYLKISQDDVNGTADITVRKAAAGETMAKAFTAVEGSNTVATAGWYKYTHTGDNKVFKLSGISKVYNEDGGNAAEGDDVKIGFVIEEGTTVYFVASTVGFTLTLENVEKGMTADDPVILTNESGAIFSLKSSAATDTYRYMQYAAAEDGTFIYATQNAKVMEYKNSATVRDITNPDAPKTVSAIQEETSEFGEPYFIYKWTVIAGHTYAIEQGLGNNFGTVEFLTMFVGAEPGETFNKALAIDLYEAKDLGRKTTTAKFYKFTAEEAGKYTVSVQMKGSVKSYDAEGNSSSITQSYEDGLVYHNGTFELAAGESVVFSCEPSEDIEHIDVEIKDQFIPNYYATVTKADETGGIDYNQPMAIELDDESSIADNNVWHGPIAVPAGEKLYVVATTDAEINALYFVSDETGSLQWLNKSTELSVEMTEGKQVYTIAAVEADRSIQILSYGMACSGTFMATLTDPSTPVVVEKLALTITPTFGMAEGKVTATFTIPATYEESETAVAGLSLAAIKLVNKTTGKEMEISAATGEGTYNAGDEFSIANAVAEDFLAEGENTLVLELESWGATKDVVFTFNEAILNNVVDAIESVKADSQSAVIYNMAGQRSNNAKGIMVRNGKAVLVK